MKQIAIFASGSGTNAENIINYFSDNQDFKVVLLCTNHSDALVVQRVKKLSIPIFIFTPYEINNSSKVLEKLKLFNVSIVILAGFLLKIPDSFIQKFPNAIINIHPSLLPKYGGKGMFGMKVHRAVIENKEVESGITIHHVNKNYDDGAIIFQATCMVDSDESPSTLQKKIQLLEHEHFPKVIDTHFK
tara:strand:- start:1864 stop:2427 length:564 start_codon:yes stop_codon:yes gene_type:complete